VRRVIIAVATSVALLTGACSGDDGSASSDQRAINSVIVGSYDNLSTEDSEVVSAIGAELVALGAPLQAFVDGEQDREQLMTQMTAAVDRIEGRLTDDRAPEVVSTFAPYVEAWRDLLAALAADDQDAYDRAVDRLRDLDQIRIDRVIEAYGDEVGRSLVEQG
jgi:hypothetical protein